MVWRFFLRPRFFFFGFWVSRWLIDRRESTKKDKKCVCFFFFLVYFVWCASVPLLLGSRIVFAMSLSVALRIFLLLVIIASTPYFWTVIALGEKLVTWHIDRRRVVLGSVPKPPPFLTALCVVFIVVPGACIAHGARDACTVELDCQWRVYSGGGGSLTIFDLCSRFWGQNHLEIEWLNWSAVLYFLVYSV